MNLCCHNTILISREKNFMNKLCYSLLFLAGMTYAMDEKQNTALENAIKTMNKEESKQEHAFKITASLAQQSKLFTQKKLTFEVPFPKESPERISLFNTEEDIKNRHKTLPNRNY